MKTIGEKLVEEMGKRPDTINGFMETIVLLGTGLLILEDKVSGKSEFNLKMGEAIKEQQIATLIFTAINSWDYNIASKTFANELAKKVIEINNNNE